MIVIYSTFPMVVKQDPVNNVFGGFYLYIFFITINYFLWHTAKTKSRIHVSGFLLQKSLFSPLS